MALNDDFLIGVKQHFYSDSRDPGRGIFQISEFGSQNCIAKVFDASSGEYITESPIRTEGSRFYERVSTENLPVSLREKEKHSQKLEQLAQSSFQPHAPVDISLTEPGIERCHDFSQGLGMEADTSP